MIRKKGKKRQEQKIHTGHGEEGHADTEADFGGMCLQAKGCQALWQPPEAQAEAWDRLSPRYLPALQTP